MWTLIVQQKYSSLLLCGSYNGVEASKQWGCERKHHICYHGSHSSQISLYRDQLTRAIL